MLEYHIQHTPGEHMLQRLTFSRVRKWNRALARTIDAGEGALH
jgi:hypothetical protein